MNSGRVKKITMMMAIVLGMALFAGGTPRAQETASEAQYLIKFALLAPEGSTWHRVLKDFDKEVYEKSGGRMKLKIYAGGVAGDETDILRKIRIGQMHAGGFTGLGLGEIVPDVRVKELPFLLDSYAQVDKVNEALLPHFEKSFLEKGFVYLGNAEAGFVYILSNKAIRNLKDSQGVKFWMWAGDPLAEALFKEFKITPIPLALPDVLTSLQTNLIDAVYAPPLGAVALQWFTRTKYMTNVRFTNSTGGMVVSKKYFDTLPADLQKILKEAATKSCRALIEVTRTDNEKSIEAMKRSGIQLVDVNPADLQQFVNQSRTVWQALVGKLYTQELLDRVKGIVGK